MADERDEDAQEAMHAAQEAMHAAQESHDRRAAAAARILAAEPMAVPDVDDLLAELDALRSRLRGR